MVKKSIIYIFIYTLLVGCNTVTEPSYPNYVLEVTAPGLELDVNGYYHIEYINNSIQTFTTLDANTDSKDMYQKVIWHSFYGIYEAGTNDFVSCVNTASYTNSEGIAHTVLSVWEEMIGDTLVISAWYADENGIEYEQYIGVIVEDEI